MDRRSFLTASLGGAATIGLAEAAPARARRPVAPPPFPIASLRHALQPQDASVLAPTDGDYGRYQRYAAANLRAAHQPHARVLIRTPQGAAAAVNWLRRNGVAFSIRGGGHCYEAFSQNDSVVLDMRGLADIQIAPDGASVSVGGGALLGQIYAALVAKGRVFPAGSCPQVGAAGHTLGGGYGMLARKFGLTCDSLIGAELVDAKGRILAVDDAREKDLFWALRGGGAGSFGVVTRLIYKTIAIAQGARFAVEWGADGGLSIERAVAAFQAWQAWAPGAPRELTPIMRISARSGRPQLRCFGISANPDAAWVKQQIAHLARQTGGALGAIEAQAIEDLLKHFSGPADALTGGIDARLFFDPTYYKGKSDVISSPLDAKALKALIAAVVKAGAVDVICDPYGGAIADIADDAMAFVHRSKTVFNMQYFTEWTSPRDADGRKRLNEMADVYAALAPVRSGAAYFNYCDLDLGKTYATNYWGANLARLKSVKAAYDPQNLFHHAQSAPL